MSNIKPPKISFLMSVDKKHALITSFLNQIKLTSCISLNLGCGAHPKEGYINCDLYSPMADVSVDIKMLSSTIKEADLIEAHHVLEHLPFAESVMAVKDWVSVLRPGGYLIISAPDFEACLKKFLKSNEDQKWESVIKMIYGSQEHEGMYHKSAFTPTRLKEILMKQSVGCILLVTGYPVRPTPSFLYVGMKTA